MATVIEKRVSRVLNDLHLIGNRTADVTSPEDVEKVEQAISDALAASMARLRQVKAAREKATFTL